MKIVPADEREWTPQTFDADRDIPGLDEALGDVLNAWDTDLSAFRDNGGKLIVYHGWADPVLSPYNSIQYREELIAFMGEEAVSDFYRLYMAPGVAHCRGGAGPDRFDALGPLVKWVEEGEAPGAIVAYGDTPGGGPRARPLCVYPLVAVYDGQGDPDDARSYSCAPAPRTASD